MLVALMIGGAGIALWVITVNARYQDGETEYWSAATVTGALLGIVVFYDIARAMGRPFSQPPDLRDTPRH